MRNLITIALRLTLAACLAASVVAQAQTIGSSFSGSYSAVDLGSAPGLPTSYGGLTFLDNDTLLIGGAANTSGGRIYTLDVTRDGSNHINGFSGSASLFGGSIGEYNDGGVVFGPGGVLFTSQWPVNKLGQTKPGSTNEDKVIDLAALGVAGSHAAINFVPSSFAGAGNVKLVSWSGGQWYNATLTPDGMGTYDLAGLTQIDLNGTDPGMGVLGGGPEGFTYVSAGNPGFSVNSMLVSEYSAGSVAAYNVDANGDPILSSRRTFLSGLTGAEGAVLDPLTGDFLFSTFGSVNHLVRVSGFTVLPPTTAPVPEPETYAMLLAGLGLLRLTARRRNQKLAATA